MTYATCGKCHERYHAGGGNRERCGRCEPRDRGIDWRKVPVSAERRAQIRGRLARIEEGEAESD